MEFLDAIPLFWQDLSRLRVSKDCFAPFLSQQGQTHKISQTEDIGKWARLGLQGFMRFCDLAGVPGLRFCQYCDPQDLETRQTRQQYCSSEANVLQVYICIL